MRNVKLVAAWAVVFGVLGGVACFAQGPSTGPDVIVGSLPNMNSYGSTTGNKSAYSVATTSCNVGDADLSWIANTPAHPVIGQTLYRIFNGRITQIGSSWLKHGFIALTGSLCMPCPASAQGGSVLNPACSDPYSASLNGAQGGLGSRSEVNATSGAFPYPPVLTPPINDLGDRRVVVDNADLDQALNPGALYFAEGHYIAADDAAAGNDDNNASYRPVIVNQSSPTTFGINVTGVTEREKPGIMAWSDTDPDVFITAVDIPNDGRVFVAFKQTPGPNGDFHYEFAIQNLNSHASIRQVDINLTGGATVSAPGFRDYDYHSGDPWSTIDWTPSTGTDMVSWSTSTFAQNANASAIRWGALDNFWFDSSGLPVSIDLHTFRPIAGVPATVNVPLPAPAFSYTFPNGLPTTMLPDAPLTFDVQVNPIAGMPNPLTGSIVYSTDGGMNTTMPLVDMGGNMFQATLPPTTCLSTVSWYVTMSPVGGGAPVTAPASAPAGRYDTMSEGQLLNVAAFDFQFTNGWTVSNSASLTGGAWSVGVPVGMGDRGDPANDSDGSGQCFVTDPADGDTDVDSGATTLTSPPFNLIGFSNARISWDMWYDNAFGANPNQDSMLIEISDDGTNWVTVEQYGASVGSWVARSIGVMTYVNLTATVQIRFTVSDIFPESIVEAGLDNFRVDVCPEGPFLAGSAVAGNVGGSAQEQVFCINGLTGGALRRVDVQFGSTFVMQMANPSATLPGQAPFAVYGQFNVETPGFAYTLPLGFGEMSMIPCEYAVNDPSKFLLVSNWFTSQCGPGLLNMPPAPSFAFVVAPSVPISIQLQGAILDQSQATNVAITNALILRFTP